nr:MAG TPA: hypothetical protein [Bacteriophage sp.]
MTSFSLFVVVNLMKKCICLSNDTFLSMNSHYHRCMTKSIVF